MQSSFCPIPVYNTMIDLPYILYVTYIIIHVPIIHVPFISSTNQTLKSNLHTYSTKTDQKIL